MIPKAGLRSADAKAGASYPWCLASPLLCMGSRLVRYFPEGERDIPLAVKYETSSIWPEIKRQFGVDATGAGIAMALLDASLIGNRMVSYSRDLGYYSKRNCHPLLSYRKVIRAVGALDDGGWITHHRQCPGGRGLQSAMAGKPEFCQALNRLAGPLPLAVPRNSVILRDHEGRSVDVPKTRMVGRMERKIFEFNEAITSIDARTAAGVSVGATVVRIFNQTMNRGGRLYGLGASWQNIPAEDRQRISIDGEPVVELDYSALHPALLYAEIGAPLPDDCYIIGNWPRPLVKLGLLVLINASNLHQVRLYLAHCDAMAALGPADDQDALAKASRLIDDIKAVHRPIVKFFHSDAGARLMRVDSDLAVSIMAKLLRRGILALPVHDSFLVPACHVVALEETMLDCAAEIGLIQCKVEKAS